jgi:hypothetical protein
VGCGMFMRRRGIAVTNSIGSVYLCADNRLTFADKTRVKDLTKQTGARWWVIGRRVPGSNSLD